MKETDFNFIKNQAKLLLYLDVYKTDIDMIVSHPFISYRYVYTGKNDKAIDVLKEEGLKEIRHYYEDIINKSLDVYHITWLINAPYRPLFFKLINQSLSDKDFAELLNSIWVGTENPNQDPNVSISTWIKYFKKANKNLLMSEDELNIYNSINDDIIIYRGVGKDREPYGLSWTKNYETAEWFAKRWENKDAYIFKTVCNKKDILAYFNSRNEDELVVNVKKLNKDNFERIKLYEWHD